MREILQSLDPLPFLDRTAQVLLDEARHAARVAGVCTQTFIAPGPRKTIVMTWAGTRMQRTLMALLAVAGVPARDRHIAAELDMPEAETRALITAPFIAPQTR